MKSFFEKPNRRFCGPGRKMLRTVLSCLLTLAVLAGASYAWYVRNIELQSTNGVMLTSQGSGAYTTTYSVYLYNADFTDVEKHSAEDVSLHGYDTIFTERNAYTPAIICVPVFGTSVTDGTAFTVNIQCSGGLFDPENNVTNTKMLDNLSNVIGVRCACLNIVPPDAPGATQANNLLFFNAVHPALQNVACKTFVDYQTAYAQYGDNSHLSDWTKNNTLSFTVSSAPRELAYVYIEIDYDAVLVGTYRYQNENSNASGEGQNGSGDIFSGALSWKCTGDLISIYFS